MQDTGARARLVRDAQGAHRTTPYVRRLVPIYARSDRGGAHLAPNAPPAAMTCESFAQRA